MIISELQNLLDITHFKKSSVSVYKDGWKLDSKSQGITSVLQDDIFEGGSSDKEQSWSSEIEELHEEPTKNGWIDVYERECVKKILFSVLKGTAKDNIVVEFGSSAGYMIDELKQACPSATYVATDLLKDGLELSYHRNPDIMHIQCDFTQAPFRDGVIDLVFSLNVLEHIPNDAGAICECCRILKKGGFCLFVVPRGEKLYDYFDETLFHKRRYARGELRRKSQDAGFTVVKDFHFAWLCYPAFWIKKKMNRFIGKRLTEAEKMEKVKADIKNAMASPLAIGLMHLENRLSDFITPPFGVREIILLKKD